MPNIFAVPCTQTSTIAVMEQRGRIQKLRELRKKYDRPVAALLDTKGPEIKNRNDK